MRAAMTRVTILVALVFVQVINNVRSSGLRAATYFLGANDEYTVHISNERNFNPVISVYYSPTFGQASESEMWSTVLGRPFVALGLATQHQPPILNGNFQVNYTMEMLSTMVQLTLISPSADQSSITFEGYMTDDNEVPIGTFLLKFFLSTPSAYLGRLTTKASSASLDFSVTVTLDGPIPDGGTELHTVLTYNRKHMESFYGMGEQFTIFNLTDLRVPVLVSEQGIGHGLQPLTAVENAGVAQGAGGDWFTSYAPKPLYLTNYNRSLMLDTTSTSYFDFTSAHLGLAKVEVWSTVFTGRVLLADSWLDLVQCATQFTGRQKPLPAWTQHGAIVGLEGGTANVTRIVNQLLAGGVQIAGVWLQDWVGLRHDWDGDRLIWNWELNTDYYPGWDDMVSDWGAKGIRVLTYLNPFFSDPTGFSTPTRNFFQEGIERGYFVRNQTGGVYMMNSLSISFATLDLTNPDARTWMKQIIIDETLINAKSSGWMCDFGEYLPFDAVMHDGQLGSQYHNLYPQAWAELTAEALAEYAVQYPDAANTDAVFFSRAAWTKSSASVPVFWLGDQTQSWDEFDGLASAILGALSSGLSGHAITHSDIGGYNAVTIDENDPNLYFVRNHELLRRWTEMGAFGFGLMRTHIGSSASPAIAQIYNCPWTTKHFAEFSNIFANLTSYRTALMHEAQQLGHPLVRPMAMHYSYEEQMWRETKQYLFGPDFLVAPVLYEGSNFTIVDFPSLSGAWVHLWGGNVVHSGSERFLHLRVPSPMGFPAVFFKQGSTWGAQLRSFVVSRGYTTGFTWEYNDLLVETDDELYDPIGHLTLSEKILIPIFFALLLASLAWLFMAFYHETLSACFPACCAGDDQQTVYLSQAGHRVVDKVEVDIPRYSTHGSSSGRGSAQTSMDRLDRLMPSLHSDDRDLEEEDEEDEEEDGEDQAGRHRSGRRPGDQQRLLQI